MTKVARAGFQHSEEFSPYSDISGRPAGPDALARPAMQLFHPPFAHCPATNALSVDSCGVRHQQAFLVSSVFRVPAADIADPTLTPGYETQDISDYIVCGNMSDTVAADDDNVTSPHIPAALYKIVAQYVDADDLPALRLASKSWHGAATAAVQRVGKGGFLTRTQLQRLPSAAHRFSGLSTLDVTFLAACKDVQNLLKGLQPITGLRSLSMYYTLSQLPVGQQFVLQQSQLTSFRASSLEYNAEAGILDTFLRKATLLKSLVTLDLDLSNSVTDSAIRGLSNLTNLQSLRLPVSKYDASVSGRSMTVFTNLTQLTHVSLHGWPLHDAHVAMMTALTNLQKIDMSMCQSLSSLSFMPLLQFPQLAVLDVVRNEAWAEDAIVTMFELLKPHVKLGL